MKILKLALLSLVLLHSCKKDDDNSAALDSANAALEERVLDVNKVMSSTKVKTGTSAIISASEIPATTDALSITVPEDTQTAFQKNGLDIKIGGSQSFDGVYIRTKNSNGSLSSEAIKVDFNTTSFGAVQKNDLLLNKTENKKVEFLSKVNRTNKVLNVSTARVEEAVSEKTINIDFEGLEPGRFCYSICVYVNNADGNGGQWVSRPGDVCVEVESWGGNSSIAGAWSFVSFKDVGTDEHCTKDGGSDFVCVTDGEEVYGFDSNVEYTEEDHFCGKDETFIAKNLINVTGFDLKADGTFYLSYSAYHDTTWSKEGSPNNCLDTPVRVYEDYKFYGNWAFNEEKDELTVVFFRAEGVDSRGEDWGGIDVEGELFINQGKVFRNGKLLEIVSDYLEENQGDSYKDRYRSQETFVLSR